MQATANTIPTIPAIPPHFLDALDAATLSLGALVPATWSGLSDVFPRGELEEIGGEGGAESLEPAAGAGFGVRGLAATSGVATGVFGGTLGRAEGFAGALGGAFPAGRDTGTSGGASCGMEGLLGVAGRLEGGVAGRLDGGGGGGGGGTKSTSGCPLDAPC